MTSSAGGGAGGQLRLLHALVAIQAEGVHILFDAPGTLYLLDLFLLGGCRVHSLVTLRSRVAGGTAELLVIAPADMAAVILENGSGVLGMAKGRHGFTILTHGL